MRSQIAARCDHLQRIDQCMEKARKRKHDIAPMRSQIAARCDHLQRIDQRMEEARKQNRDSKQGTVRNTRRHGHMAGRSGVLASVAHNRR